MDHPYLLTILALASVRPCPGLYDRTNSCLFFIMRLVAASVCQRVLFFVGAKVGELSTPSVKTHFIE